MDQKRKPKKFDLIAENEGLWGFSDIKMAADGRIGGFTLNVPGMSKKNEWSRLNKYGYIYVTPKHEVFQRTIANLVSALPIRLRSMFPINYGLWRLSIHAYSKTARRISKNDPTLAPAIDVDACISPSMDAMEEIIIDNDRRIELLGECSRHMAYYSSNYVSIIMNRLPETPKIATIQRG